MEPQFYFHKLPSELNRIISIECAYMVNIKVIWQSPYIIHIYFIKLEITFLDKNVLSDEMWINIDKVSEFIDDINDINDINDIKNDMNVVAFPHDNDNVFYYLYEKGNITIRIKDFPFQLKLGPEATRKFIEALEKLVAEHKTRT